MTAHSGVENFARRSAPSPIAALVRLRDRDRYQTALFAPVPAREALFALYAFNYEIARIRDTVHEPMLGQIRLQWWREVIDAAYARAAPRRHEVVEPLTAAIRGRGLSRGHFDRLIDTRERDLDPAPPATLEALQVYAEGTSAALVVLALEALGAANPAAMAAGRHVGIGYALAGLLRAMPAHASAGRSFIPDDVAAQTGLEPGVAPALRTSTALCRAVEIVARTASDHLAAARELRREMPRNALPALLSARVADRALRRIERAGFDPFLAARASDHLQIWRLTVAALRGRF